MSWDDARDYVEWLSRHTGKTYRLLTEAEWEYVARASTTTNYAFGDKITGEQARFSEGGTYSAGTTAEVGSFPANRFRLRDMHGNVGEWVEDCWNANYGVVVPVREYLMGTSSDEIKSLTIQFYPGAAAPRSTDAYFSSVRRRTDRRT